MGYHMSLMEDSFFIPHELFCYCMAALRDIAKRPELMSGSSWKAGDVVSKHFSWVDMTYVNRKTLGEMIKCWRWEAQYDDEGNINGIYFSGEKYGDDEQLFRALAPHVKSGSYIQMQGEDGAIWRWAFKDGEVREKQATVSFEE